MPAHDNLEAYLDAYMEAARLEKRKKTLRFRSVRGRTGALIERAMSRVDVYRIILRRAENAALNAEVCCHTFHATDITAYLDNGGTLENARLMAAYESPRTTKLYDYTRDKIKFGEVDRIKI